MAGVSWKFLNFHGVLQRFPSITQANSQVCFRWMSNCVIWIAWREFGETPHVKYCGRKWVTNLSFGYPENLSLTFKLFHYVESLFALNVSSSERRKKMFFSWKVSKFLHAALFANAMKVDVCEFQVKNYAILRLRLRKPIVSISSQIPYYPKAIYGQKKIKGIDFSTLAMKWRFNCSIFPNRRSYSGYH